ncbi:MAG: SAM-dependent methyltransferase, partial [Microlunatus sp.]|nr:SAM-dependent methyltransferase [Microlunatus sp.]
LAGLGAAAPRLRLLGLELRPQPAHRPDIEWRQGYWDVVSASWCAPAGDPVPLRSVLPAGEPMAIICSEWLDDLPAVVAERDATGWKELLVGADGQERAGPPVSAADRDWLERWWPARPGTRSESGRTRDAAWSAVIECLRPAGGLAVMVDYGHLRRHRPAAGTLTGYQGGRQVLPRPSPAINLTAHVAVDSVQQAGAAAGARTEFVVTQREAVERLLPGPGRTDESGTLARLQARGERRLLADSLGDHWWLVQSVAPQQPGRSATGSPAAG